MRRVALVLACLAVSAAPARAQAPAEVTLAAGAGRFVGEGGAWMGHARLGPEWVPEQGPGFALDGGWLWFGPDPRSGVGTASPSLVYSLGRHGRTTVGLRAGYTLLFREGVAHAAHAGLTIDHDLDDGRGLRLEVRDTVLPAVGPLHVVEVTVGLVLPVRPRNGSPR